MLDTKTRFKLDIAIEDEVNIRKIIEVNEDMDASSNKDGQSKVRPVKVTRELLKRIIARVERI